MGPQALVLITWQQALEPNGALLSMHLGMRSISCEVVDEELRVREIRKTEGRVGVAKLLRSGAKSGSTADLELPWQGAQHLMDDAGRCRVHSSPTVLRIDRDAEEAEFTRTLK